MSRKVNKIGQGGPKKRVLMALSGGIDSAVSAYKLLQQGYEVEAAFMKNWSSTAGLKIDACPWLVDRQDALRVAAFLGIPMHSLNFEKEYKDTVLNYFFKEYSAGRTPNPDVMCNKEIKFKLLYNYALRHGFDYVATGHYARVAKVKSMPVDNYRGGDMKNEKRAGKRSLSKNTPAKTTTESPAGYQLLRSNDEFKDQTYFIYNIKRSQLPHILFPIGSMKKSAVRALAKKIGLPNAAKKESMGLCFVGKIRLKEFLEQKLVAQDGPIIDMLGNPIGAHHGLSYYTIGQRQGVNVGPGGPWYVVHKDLKSNTLVVTNDPDDEALEVQELEIHSLNWISEPSAFPVTAKARFRHQGHLNNVTVSSTGKGHYKVKFARPQKSVASGQSLVLYNKEICLGGGVIV